MDERLRFIGDLTKTETRMAELCRLYGISRKTGYKWMERYKAGGVKGLADRAPIALERPHAMSAAVADLLVETRLRHPTWGPRKLLSHLEGQTKRQLPAPSTVGDLLRRRGLVEPSRRRRAVPPYSQPLGHFDRPNAGWSADFKGQFQMGDGQKCYPLTVTDNFSRYLLCCQGMIHPTGTNVRSAFERVFEHHGVPDAIRTDNGVPFATNTVGGLSALSVWWVRLGIRHERIERGKPEQNGRHERMHRTLKRETARPPKATIISQQRAFDDFIQEYNEVRPHEAIGQKPPATVYQPSLRTYTPSPPEPAYPAHYQVRRVRSRGQFKWKDREVYLSEALCGEPVGLEEIDDGRWLVHFGPLRLGVVDDIKKANKVSPMLPV